MPWHSTAARTVEWSGTRPFRKAVVERFGHGRIWLAGDAAHVTSPLGAQSLNVGLREARDLVSGVSACLDGRDLEHLVAGYGEQRRLEWRRLLGLDGKPAARRATPVWASAHLDELVSALPASGDDLDDLLDQLGLTLP
jgi:2-polyprenyl-6-methoxyphenol hydroxylase-like FAD-dependent oxidoreductase